MEDRIHFQLPPAPPSMPHEDQITLPPPPPPAMTLISSPLISSQTTPVVPTLPPTQPLVFPSAIQETNVSVHNAVETGRAVAGPNGTLVCKFFQEGTCRYGPYCWFNHPILNENKAICRHWKKGQCRMGLSCNYRHGTQHPMQPSRRPRAPPIITTQQQQRDPSVAGPSGEGSSSRNNHHEPSIVVFVSNWGNTIHRPSDVDRPTTRGYRQQRRNNQHLLMMEPTSSSSDSSETETFFDVFGGGPTTNTTTASTT